MSLSETHSKHLKENLAFLDSQSLIQPAVNEQIGFDFQGLRRSYKDHPTHPDAKFIARYGRVWIYDVALSIYADLKAGRLRQAGYQVGRVMQLALKEEEKGFRGLWHFSYNTLGDIFIDPRGPTGANAWCLNAIYSFILSSGNTTALEWANRVVREYLFRQQVMDPHDRRFGLIRAGLHNAEDVTRGPGMGYRVYEGPFNHPYEHIILEHNADCAGTFRLAFKATRQHAPQEKKFLEELMERHDILMNGMRRSFWKKDHFVSAMDADGELFTGTDGLPSIAVDNNTWAAHVFLSYDLGLVLDSIRYVKEHFLIDAPPAHVEDTPEGTSRADLQGLYFFPATFQDPFVQVSSEHREKMERLLHPEAAFGFILLLKDVASAVTDPAEKARLTDFASELFDHTIELQRLYGPSGAPYASANVPMIFSTLQSVTTAATGVIATMILQGALGSDFIGVVPPPEFLVNGQAPRISV